MVILGHHDLDTELAEYVEHNSRGPHRSLRQRAPRRHRKALHYGSSSATATRPGTASNTRPSLRLSCDPGLQIRCGHQIDRGAEERCELALAVAQLEQPHAGSDVDEQGTSLSAAFSPRATPRNAWTLPSP